MKNKLTRLTATFLLFASFFTSYGQPPLERYYIVTLKGDIVKSTLNDHPDFAFFDFTFKQLDDDNYSLEGYACDSDSNRISSIIELIPHTNRPTRPLRNLEKGHLYLDKATMTENNVDGSEDYVLSPKKCKNRSGVLVDYVSYRFSNKVTTDRSYLFGVSVRAFDLNPSPPY